MSETTTGSPDAAAQRGLDEWHRIIAELDWAQLPSLLADDISYRSPAETDPRTDKSEITAVLGAVFTVFEDFAYLRQYDSEAGYVLEFTARVGDDVLVGADFIEFDADGRIADLQVMIRPAGTVATLVAEAIKLLNPS